MHRKPTSCATLLAAVAAVAFCLGPCREAAAGSSPVVYMDNGVQTVRQDVMSAEERNEVEEELLTMFGVPKKPMNAPKNLDGSAPQFLFDVYRSIQQDGTSRDRKTRSLADVMQYDDQTVKDSDVILTLYMSNHPPMTNVRHEHGKNIVFDVDDVPPERTHLITAAEVHMYQSRISNGPDNVKKYSVTLYQVLVTSDGDKELEFVDTLNTTSDYDGWLRFNVTGAVVSWSHFAYPNRGLYLSVHSFVDGDHEIKPEEMGMTTWADKHQVSENKKPFVVVYLTSRNGVNIINHSLKKRFRRRRKTIEKSFNSNPFQSVIEGSQIRSCQIQTLYVSFRDLEWQDWIIAPDGYGAYYCNGECHFPLNAHMNATNHAIVQTLVHLMSPLQIPKPCCAPTKMAQLPVLFFLEDNNVILKKYRNMIVKSCGCH